MLTYEEIEAMPIGTVFYYISTTNNSEKISFTDAEGFVWHRYVNVPVEHCIKELEITGKLRKVIEGHYQADSYQLEPDIQVRYPDGKIDDFYFSDHNKYFKTFSEAEECLNVIRNG